MFGLLNVNKPPGMTSRDVVNRVQVPVRPAKVGHAGTLDPLATGVLVVCVGPATRLVPYVQRLAKRYVGTFLLGRTSNTEDIDGDVVTFSDAPIPERSQIEEILPQFTGKISQRPPAYSALKLAGQRAHKLARQGKPVRLEPRPVEVYGIELVSYDYPRLQLDIRCGSGTYVRCLGRDIAEKLGTAAVMSKLVRTRIGDFSLDDACQLDELTGESISSNLLPAVRAVQQLPMRRLTSDQTQRIVNGMTIPRADTDAAEEVAAIDKRGQLVAILAPRNNGYGPIRVFVESS